MGDIADQIIGDILDPFFEEYNEEDDYAPPTKCKFCNRSNFHWEEVRGTYRLHTRTGKIHLCSKYRKVKT
jgi:hypothetical protein